MRDDGTYLKHILEAIETIESYIAEADYESFAGNRMMVDAVIRELAIIGEAASNITADFQRSHPEMPFRRMRTMRNFLIHEYFGVNTRTVWDTCKDDLPTLKPVVEQALDG